MLDPIYISILAGLGVGAISSTVLGAASKPGPNSYTRMIFGVTTSDLLVNTLVAAMVAIVIFLSVMSALVRDLDYPRNHPLMFTGETLAMAIVPALLLLAMAPARGHSVTSIWKEVIVLALKFGVLHILFRFSGLYSATLFPPIDQVST